MLMKCKRTTSYSFTQVQRYTEALLPLENKCVCCQAVLLLKTTSGCCAFSDNVVPVFFEQFNSNKVFLLSKAIS